MEQINYTQYSIVKVENNRLILKNGSGHMNAHPSIGIVKKDKFFIPSAWFQENILETKETKETDIYFVESTTVKNGQFVVVKRPRCQMCQTIYNSINKLKQHYQKCNGTNGSFKCQKCERTFSTRMVLGKHLRYCQKNLVMKLQLKKQ